MDAKRDRVKESGEAAGRRADQLDEAAAHRAELASAGSFFIPPPFAWANRLTGRSGWQPSFELIAFGMYVKRARHLSRTSQTRLEAESGVDQGQISRLERALAPWTRVEDLVSMGTVLGRALPLGFCPHLHWCEWQPAPQPPPEKTWQEKWAEAEARYHGSDDAEGVD